VTTSLITNTIIDPAGAFVASVVVTAKLMPSTGFRTDTFTEVARSVTATSNASGFWSLALERNSNISPSNTWYEITEAVPDANGGKRVWTIAVGASDQTVYASQVTPAEQSPTVVPAGTSYITQAAGDARYQALGSLGSATPATEVPDGAGTAGVSASAQRADHIHPLPTSAATPAALSLTNTGAAGATGAIARSQHVHPYNPPSCGVTNSAVESINNATQTVITFNTERWKTDAGMHSTSSLTSRLVATVAGLYLIRGEVGFVANATGLRAVGICLNAAGAPVFGTNYIIYDDEASIGGANDTHVSVSTVYKLALNDYVELGVFQSSGAPLNITKTANHSPELSMTWIGVG
jgi:hypothetical protein